MGKKKKVVSVEELRGSHEEWLNSIINAPISPYKSQSPQRIHKVPQMLRETKDFQIYYAPRVVSIGPYHYRDKKLQQMNKLKLQIASKFVTNDKKQQQLKDLYGELFKMVKYLRNCYDGDQNSSSTDDDDHIPDDEEFTRMMLLDGCFILYYINYVGKENDHEVLGMQTHHIAFVQQDLFLLENQLPFPVLELLLKKSMMLTTDGWLKNMSEFILQNIMAPPSNKNNVQPQIDFNENFHQRPAHLLELLHRTIVGTGRPERCQHNLYTFRNVKELREVGMRLKPAHSSCLTDIQYARPGIFGRLELPPIIVDDATKAKFLNLIAYETCPDAYDQELWVTSYVCFLDSLIDHADDVKELRSAQILHNNLGSDEDVAKLFNEIGTDLVPQPCAYSKVKSSIQSHYKSKGLNYMAQFKHQHLKNPWTILALFAGFVVLFLSGVQTYFQVWSSPSDCDHLCKHIRIREHI